ncbi:MAG: GAF domain-containing protein, partial [Alphaproteobacteria bacterium]
MHQPALPDMTGSALKLFSRTTQAHRLERIRSIASAVNQSGALETILDRVLSTICSSEPWSRGGIMAVNRVSGFSELVIGYHPGEVRHPGLPTAWTLSSSPALHVAETRQPLIIADAQAATQFADYQADALARGYRTVILLPMGCSTDEGHDMVLSIHTPYLIEVSEQEIDFLVTTAHLVAIAVNKSRHLQRERRQNERLRSVLDRDADLMGLVLGGADIAAIASMVGAMLAYPFVVIDFIGDATTARQSVDADNLSDREWAALVEGLAAPLLGNLIAQAGANGADMVLDLSSIGLPIVLPTVVEPLRIQGETVGGLLVFPRGRRLDDIDRLIVQEVRFALGAHMMQRHADAKRATRDISDFLEQLCRGGIVDPAHAQARARRLGLDLNRPCFLLTVVLPKAVAPPFAE